MSGQTAWERWELATFDTDIPVVAANGGARCPEGGPSALPIDRAELERLCAQAREEGYQAGHHSGFAIGKRNGYAEGQAEAKAEARRIAQAADNLDQALKEFDQQVADELLALAVEIARQVVRKEIATQPDMILAVVNEALSYLPHQHAAIHLNPGDATLIRSYLGDVLTHSGHRILEEPGMKPGDCLLEAGGSQIDATTATRWRRVIENLGSFAAWDAKE